MQVRDKVRMVSSHRNHPIVVAKNVGKVGEVVDIDYKNRVKVRFGNAKVGIWIGKQYIEAVDQLTV